MKASTFVQCATAVALGSLITGCSTWGGHTYGSNPSTTHSASATSSSYGTVTPKTQSVANGSTSNSGAMTAANDGTSSSSSGMSSKDMTSAPRSTSAPSSTTSSTSGSSSAPTNATSAPRNAPNASSTEPKAPESATNASGSENGSDHVRAAQQALQDKGFSPGPIDGMMGPRTEKALRDFQNSQHINASGQLDSSTSSALGISQ